jgi:hypothetical protein
MGILKTTVFVLAAALACFYSAKAISQVGLPPCSTIAIDQATADAAIDKMLAAHGNIDEEAFGELPIAIAQSLGCQIVDIPDVVFSDGFDVASTISPTGVNICFEGVCTCDRNYCPSIRYCGASNSGHDILTVAGSDSLNHLCFQHDLCYASTCFSDHTCVFANNNVPTSACDQPLLDYCGDPPSFDTLSFTDYLVCRVIGAARQNSLPWCADDGATATMPMHWELDNVCDGGSPPGQHTVVLDLLPPTVPGGFYLTGTFDGYPIGGSFGRYCGTTIEEQLHELVNAPRGRGLWITVQNEPDAGVNIFQEFSGGFLGESFADPVTQAVGNSYVNGTGSQQVGCNPYGSFTGVGQFDPTPRVHD